MTNSKLVESGSRQPGRYLHNRRPIVLSHLSHQHKAGKEYPTTSVVCPGVKTVCRVAEGATNDSHFSARRLKPQSTQESSEPAMARRQIKLLSNYHLLSL